MAEIVGIKYIGPCLDSSGYAKANRGNILALHNAGIPITVSPISFEDIRPDFGEEGEVLNTLIGKDIDYNIVIVHTTPEFWSKFMEEEKISVFVAINCLFYPFVDGVIQTKTLLYYMGNIRITS